jgi:hypothetical protein
VYIRLTYDLLQVLYAVKFRYINPGLDFAQVNS